MTKTVQIVTWNIQRQAPTSRRAKIMMERIQAQSPDIICLTEGFLGSTAALGGFEISVAGAAWSRKAVDERLVVLWSRQPWTDLNIGIEPDLQRGAFLDATTATPIGEIRVVGICAPYHFASPFGVSPRARPWSEQIRFFDGLRSELSSRVSDATTETVILGDFNQYVPRIWGSKAASVAMNEALGDLRICTMGPMPGVGRAAIDHIAASPALRTSFVSGIDEHDEAGRPLSDHFGVVSVICRPITS